MVYILYSERYGKTYTGYTSDLISRMRAHNGFATKGFTRKFRPWKVVYIEAYETKKAAMNREKFLKSGVGREWIRDKFVF